MKVRDNLRVNPLSHKPGGEEIRITFANGSHRDYDKVKYTQKYVEQCFKMDDSIVSAQIIGHSPELPKVFRVEWLSEQQQDAIERTRKNRML